jgi:hypothetical protein
VDTQQWWDSLSPEAQDALARDPHGPVPAGVADEVTATGRAWSASWESDYVRRENDRHFLAPELAQFVDENNASLLQRLKEGSAEFRDATDRVPSGGDGPDDDDPNLVAYQADWGHARARGLPLPAGD